MKWQRARIVYAPDMPHIQGRTCWLRIGSSRMIREFRRDVDGKLFMPTDAVYDSNLRMGAVEIVITATAVELLPEFANEVPLVPFQSL